MTIYLDVVLLENLCMNYIILFATGYIMKVKTKQWRLIVAATIRRSLRSCCILKYFTNIFKFDNESNTFYYYGRHCTWTKRD